MLQRDHRFVHDAEQAVAMIEKVIGSMLVSAQEWGWGSVVTTMLRQRSIRA